MQFIPVYFGIGILEITKEKFGNFQHVQDSKEKPGFVDTEYVPGFGSIQLRKDLWDSFVGDQSKSSIKLSYPDWTTQAYEDFLLSKVDQIVKPDLGKS